MLMNSAESLEQIRRPLVRAQWMLILKTAARLISWMGLVLLLIESYIIFFEKKDLQNIFLFLPISLGIFFLSSVVAVIYAWKNWRHLESIAVQSQNHFPELGLRLSASLEAPHFAYCPPSIQNALWRDTWIHLAKIPSKRFLSLGSTATWILLALCIILSQVGLNVLWLQQQTLFQPLKKESVLKKETIVNKTEEILISKKTEPPIKPTLEISQPGKDEWATKIEAIPLTVLGKSPFGFSKLRLSVTVNGQPPKEFPLDQDSLPKTQGETTGSLYLDELEIQNYDVVSYSVIGQATKAEGAPLEIVSPLYFIQIRPFRKEAGIGEKYRGNRDFDKFIDLLNWLIEEQRGIIRETWRLTSEKKIQQENESYGEASESVAKSQKNVVDRTKSAYEFAGAKAQDTVPMEALVQLDKAYEEMQTALASLQTQAWESALPPEQRALSTLVEILRTIKESFGKSASQMKHTTLKDRQTYRLQELQKWLDQQKQLKQEAKNLSPQTSNLSPSELSAQQQNLAEQQREIDQKIKEAMGAPRLHEILEEMAADQQELREKHRDHPEKQALVADHLSVMKEQMKKMAEQTGKAEQEALQKAIQKIQEAGEMFSKQKGTATTLDEPMKAIAKAYEEKVGRRTHLVQLQEDLQQLKQQMEGLRHTLDKNQGGKTSSHSYRDSTSSDKQDSIQEWIKKLEERSHILQSEIEAALGARGTNFQIAKLGLQELYDSGHLNDGIHVLNTLQNLIESELEKLMSPDLLKAMQDEEIPPEYRDLVNAYFEKLSRQSTETTQPK